MSHDIKTPLSAQADEIENGDMIVTAVFSKA